jgi:hypothetical protein
MKTGLVVAVSIGAVVGLAAFVLGGSYISAYNQGNRMEKVISATYQNNQNVLSTYYQKVQEVAQVPGMMKDDLKEVITGALAGRYGPNGSQAVFNWVKENYPGTVDASLYKKIQQVIESGRDEFKISQTRLIDQKRAYETELGSFWTGTWMRIAGYPKVNLADFKVILTTETKEVFDKGVEKGPLKLR